MIDANSFLLGVIIGLAIGVLLGVGCYRRWWIGRGARGGIRSAIMNITHTLGGLMRTPFRLFLLGVCCFLAMLICLVFTIFTVGAQGGYTISDDPPLGYQPLDSRFYMPALNAQTGQQETILCNIAGFVIWEDGRAPDYYVLRIDNLYNISEWADVLNAWAGYKPGYPQFPMHPDDKPPPTFFIFGPATLAQFDVHAPHL